VHYAHSFKGITGNTTLNEMGDRERAEYDIMAIKYVNNENDNKTPFIWQKVNSYDGS
jgi:hypothetical protein